MLATLLLTLVLQDPGSADPPVPAVQPTTEPAVAALTDEQVKVVLAAYKTASKDKKANMATRLAAIEALGKGSHDKLVAPLVTAVKRERQLTLRRAAAKDLGHQPDKAARKAIVKLLEDRNIEREPLLVAELIGAFDTAGYQSKYWRTLEKMFERDFSEPHRAKQRAILLVAKHHKELEAIDLLLRHIDEPGATNVDSASNPPAEYWEQRWKAWRAWRVEAVEALHAITGQRFSTAEEARIWLKKNRKKLRK